jgi:hypothetical protein
LGTLWLPFGHVVPTPATVTRAAPRVAGRLVAGVRERFPAPVSAGAPESTAVPTVVVAPAPAEAAATAVPQAPAAPPDEGQGRGDAAGQSPGG